mgnify:CR=1 FL=1
MNTDTSDPRITGEHLRRLSGSDGVGDEVFRCPAH